MWRANRVLSSEAQGREIASAAANVVAYISNNRADRRAANVGWAMLWAEKGIAFGITTALRSVNFHSAGSAAFANSFNGKPQATEAM